jgi:hypothetical protein
MKIYTLKEFNNEYNMNYVHLIDMIPDINSCGIEEVNLKYCELLLKPKEDHFDVLKNRYKNLYNAIIYTTQYMGTKSFIKRYQIYFIGFPFVGVSYPESEKFETFIRYLKLKTFE